MGLSSKYSADQSAERDGVWFSITDFNEEGEQYEICAFRIARAGGGNAKFAEQLAKRTKNLQLAIEHGKVPERVMRKITQQVFAEACLREWRGDIDFKDGTKAGEKVTVDEAMRLFKEYPDLWGDLLGFARTAEVYRSAVLQAAEGNS